MWMHDLYLLVINCFFSKLKQGTLTFKMIQINEFEMIKVEFDE